MLPKHRGATGHHGVSCFHHLRSSDPPLNPMECGPPMLPACRTGGEGFAIPTFDLVPNDVEGFMEELWEFQSALHDCFARSEPRASFFDSMAGQVSPLERQSVEPAHHVRRDGLVSGGERGDRSDNHQEADPPQDRPRQTGLFGEVERAQAGLAVSQCGNERERNGE